MHSRHKPNQNLPRFLYVSSEIYPFLETSEVSRYVRNLLAYMRKKRIEIRILVPRFSVINERQHKLHEVVRLSGVNIQMGKEDKHLIIRVSNIPQAKLQVYFVDNEDYFSRKGVYHGNANFFYEDNHERMAFFCKGVLETVKKLGWQPDIIHCHDWFTSLIPLYLKTIYQNEPTFVNSKCIFTAYNTYFDDKFGDTIKPLAISSKIAKLGSQLNFFKLIGLASKYSRKTILSNKVIENIINENLKLTNLETIPPNENYEDLYWNIYQSLLSKNKSSS